MGWVLKNLWQGLKRYPLWIRLAITDIQQTYRRSVFGMAWVAFSFAMFIIVKIVIFGSISSVDTKYFALWLTIGFWVWTLIFGSVIDGCNTFVTARAWILGTNLPLSVYIFQTHMRVLIKFLFSAPVIIAILVYYQWAPTTTWFWALPGFLAVLLNALWVQIFFGVLSTRYRDITHLILAVMQVLFFITPILYVPEQLGDKAYLLNYNPFTHFLAVIRDPIVRNSVPPLSWIVVTGFTVCGWCLALLAYRGMARRVPFFV